MKINKIFWWILTILWAFPELFYISISKEVSKIGKCLADKLEL